MSQKSGHPLRDYYSSIFSTYDRVNRVFTFGRDRSWRERAAKACLESGPGSLLDLCTGTGDLLLEVARLAARERRSVSLTGFDFSLEMLQEARRKWDARAASIGKPGPGEPGNTTIKFIQGEAASMPFGDAEFDAIGITFGMRNLLYQNPDSGKHLFEISRVLRPGGRLVLLESSRPINPIWRMFNNIYLRCILPFLGGILSGNLAAYRYLGRSSRDYYSIPEMGSVLERSGFRVICGSSLFLGSVMLVVAEKD
jgi:demethylmenaquinone methyltransferase/2-methoxy-6-polyprenyl-1,4-benzoquinol methylase